MSRVYLYALLSETPACETGVGVCSERLRVVALGDLVALVGDVGEPPAPTAVTLRAQDMVLRRLCAAVDALLPVRFGTLLADDAALAESLAPRQPELARAMGRISGCEQMTLRVWGEAPAAAPLAAAVEGGPGTQYLVGRRRAREWARRVPELEPARPGLADLVREERVERHDRPPLLVTVQHLVPRAAVRPYIDAIDGARGRLRPWRVSVTGPWPAYAFVDEAA
jgi:hypothetical protein